MTEEHTTFGHGLPNVPDATLAPHAPETVNAPGNAPVDVEEGKHEHRGFLDKVLHPHHHTHHDRSGSHTPENKEEVATADLRNDTPAGGLGSAPKLL